MGIDAPACACACVCACATSRLLPSPLILQPSDLWPSPPACAQARGITEAAPVRFSMCEPRPWVLAASDVLMRKKESVLAVLCCGSIRLDIRTQDTSADTLRDDSGMPSRYLLWTWTTDRALAGPLHQRRESSWVDARMAMRRDMLHFTRAHPIGKPCRPAASNCLSFISAALAWISTYIAKRRRVQHRMTPHGVGTKACYRPGLVHT